MFCFMPQLALAPLPAAAPSPPPLPPPPSPLPLAPVPAPAPVPALAAPALALAPTLEAFHFVCFLEEQLLLKTLFPTMWKLSNPYFHEKSKTRARKPCIILVSPSSHLKVSFLSQKRGLHIFQQMAHT